MKTHMSTIAFTMMKAVSFFLVFTLSMSAEAVSDKKVKSKAGGGEVLCDTALLRSFTSDEFHIYVDVDGKRLSSWNGYPGSINGLIDKNAIDTILIPTKVEDLTAYDESGKIPVLVIRLKKDVMPALVPYDLAEPKPAFTAYAGNLTSWADAEAKYSRDSLKSIVPIIASFVIGKNGKVSEGKIEYDPGTSSELTAEVLRLIKHMPRWTPGKYKGKAVKVGYGVLFVFTPKGCDPAEVRAIKQPAELRIR